MRLKWQWFLGGKFMFWVSIIIFMFLISSFVFTYIIDPTTTLYIKKQKIDPTIIKTISEKYVSNLGITIDNKNIEYNFVKYNHYRYNHDRYNSEGEDTILLGTFHEWNDTYYINISLDLYNTTLLDDIVIHETRHMIVEYLKDKKIINLDKYTEEIAEGKDIYYNNLFNSGIYLLKIKEN